MLPHLILLCSHYFCCGGCLYPIRRHHWSTLDSGNQKEEENGADVVSLWTHTYGAQSLSTTYNFILSGNVLYVPCNWPLPSLLHASYMPI